MGGARGGYNVAYDTQVDLPAHDAAGRAQNQEKSTATGAQLNLTVWIAP